MADNTDLHITVEAWAEIVIKNWLVNIGRLGISHSGQLANSFAMAVHREANGNPNLIEFAFEYYGKFVDMGVRRGVSMDSADRKPKPWYSKEFFSQVKRLSELMKEKYEQKAALAIVENIDNGKTN